MPPPNAPKMEDTEQWVQCSRCNKWRCVADDLKLPSPWLCKYNVFDPKHNQCSHAQEPMPNEDNVSSDEEDDTIEVVPEDQVDMFTPSTCTCTTCAEINASVRAWKNMQEHPVPIVNMVLQAISKTEPLVHAVEEDKQFIKGITIDLHNPGGPSTL